MSVTGFTDVANQVQTFWSPLFMDELKEETLLPSLVNKDYEGEIKGGGGDTVRVSQINRPSASLRTIGTDADTFESTKLSTSYVNVQVNKRISAAYEIEDLAIVLSQLKDQNSKIRQGLIEAVDIKLNDYLYSLVSPSSSAPTHLVSAVTDFNASQMNATRKLAAQAKWKKDGWYLLADPSYMSDILNAATLTSKDYIDGEMPVIGGQIASRRFGFNILEDNSEGLITAMQRLGSSTATEDAALAFHPDFMHLVMGEPKFEISSLVSNKQFGYVVVVHMWVGAALGIDGDNKHIFTYAS